MPKKRQIPFLFAKPNADGSRTWHWKPSARLRAAGFLNVRLGTDQRLAIAAAIDLNEQLAAWEAGNAGATTAAPAGARPVPRVVRFDELVRRYRQSVDYTDLRPATRHNYEVRLHQLATWAMDGSLPVRDITVDLVRTTLRDPLMQGSRWKAASVLAVLRLLLAFAEREGIIPRGSNPATSIRVAEPPARKTRMGQSVREAIVEAAIALDDAYVPLMIELGLWTIQREADLLHLNRLAWREVFDREADPRFLAVLAGAKGLIMGFRLQQRKTGAWVDAPLPPWMHDEVEARWRSSNATWLFPHPDDPARPLDGYLFRRRFRAARDAAAAVAIMEDDLPLAEAIDACQFRDLRRTGMIFYKDAGAKVPNITALSGHYVLGKRTILDVYMPGDTAGAIACVAAGVRAYREAQKRREAEGA